MTIKILWVWLGCIYLMERLSNYTLNYSMAHKYNDPPPCNTHTPFYGRMMLSCNIENGENKKHPTNEPNAMCPLGGCSYGAIARIKRLQRHAFNVKWKMNGCNFFEQQHLNNHWDFCCCCFFVCVCKIGLVSFIVYYTISHEWEGI